MILLHQKISNKQILKLCANIAEEGSLKEINGDPIDNIEEYMLNAWKFKYQSKEYEVYVEYEKGFQNRIGIFFSEV